MSAPYRIFLYNHLHINLNMPRMSAANVLKSNRKVSDWEKLVHYREWCKINVGPNAWNYYGEYKQTPLEFRFKREEDLLAFIITFGLHDAPVQYGSDSKRSVV